MALEKCLFVSRLVIYCILWVLSFLCWIPLCIEMDKHWGYCLLYADKTAYGPVSVCGYTISVPIIFSLLYGGYMAVSYICKIAFYNKYGYVEETVLEFIITVIMDGLAWIFMFVNASLISSGFNEVCWNTFGSLEKCSLGYIKHPVFGVDSKFFLHFKIAEVAAWLSWLMWLVQLITGLVALSRSGILPFSSMGSAVSGIVPCKPTCTCSCRLHFNRPERQTPNTAAAAPDPGSSSPHKTAVSNV